MRSNVLLFFTATVLAGLGGAVGSILGNAGGARMLYVGGVIGGLVMAFVAARIGVWRGWVPRERAMRTALCAGAGFLMAALIAVNTLSSPVGPVLSASLVGIGAVLGARMRSGARPAGQVTR